MDAGLNLFRFELFVAVVDCGGYSAAAARLDLAQPVVSFHMKALERIIGAKLVIYRERGVHLTPEGEELYRAAKTVLRDIGSAMQTIQQVHAGQRGRISLGVSIAFEQRFFFKRIIGPFVRAYPNVKLSVRFGPSEDLARGAQSREFDLAYLLDCHLPAGVAYEPLHSAELVFLVSPQHPLARQERVTAQDINEVGLVALPDELVTMATHSPFRAAGIRQRHVAIEVGGVQARILAAQEGLGVAPVFLPPYADETASSGLHRLRLEREPSIIEAGLASCEGYPWTPAMQEFARGLREAVRDRTPTPMAYPLALSGH